MKVWRLIPVDTAGPRWQTSIWTGAAVVRAETEQRARRLAVLSFGTATERALTLPFVSPWGDPASVRAWARGYGEILRRRTGPSPASLGGDDHLAAMLSGGDRRTAR